MALLPNNKEISEFLKKISVYYLLEQDLERHRSFQRASESIYFHDKEITSAEDAIEVFGVGKKISQEIQEFLDTGSSKRLKELEKKHPEFYETYKLLSVIHGMGIKRIHKLYQQGVRNYEDLENKVADLTRAEKVFLKYRQQLTISVAREVIDKYNNYFHQKLKDLTWEIAGSYRRASNVVNDIDLLVEVPETPQGFSTFNVIELLKEQDNLEVISLGETRATIVLKLNNYVRQVDILLVEKENYSFALLYYTGPRNFNIILRRYAKSKGFLLNEYGLFKLENGQRIPASSEKEIFELLELPYIPSSERNILTIISSLQAN
jgi:DNA polymerase/3'-5' exonuclease PolX